MKKLLSLIIVLVLSSTLFAVVGCGEDGGKKGGTVVIDGLTIENGVVTKYEPVSESGVELVIPEKANGVNVTEIKRDVFKNCKALKTISIPSSMKKIGTGAFSGCSNLEGVYITDIGGWAGIEFGSMSANPIASENCNKLFVNGKLLEDLKLPEYVTRIERYAFYMCLSIKKITISHSIVFIGKNAFSGITSNLEQFIFDQPNNWKYDKGDGEGVLLPAPALKVSYPIPGAGDYSCAISLYNNEGHFDWKRS